MRGRKRDWQEAMAEMLPPLPPKVEFKSKFGLPKLENYRGTFKADFWAKWRVRKLTSKSGDKSWVSAEALRDMTVRAGLRNAPLVDKVCERLEKGAHTGVEGRGRLPTRVANASSVYEHGEAVTDALQEGIVDGYISGPYAERELIALVGKDFSVNKMSCKEKPNGKQRLLVDASSPHDSDESVPGWIWSPELPGASNCTVNVEQFKARMSSVKKFVKTLYRVGRGARVCKIDQTSAYKHQHVRREDWCLQEPGCQKVLESCNRMLGHSRF